MTYTEKRFHNDQKAGISGHVVSHYVIKHTRAASLYYQDLLPSNHRTMSWIRSVVRSPTKQKKILSLQVADLWCHGVTVLL